MKSYLVPISLILGNNSTILAGTSSNKAIHYAIGAKNGSVFYNGPEGPTQVALLILLGIIAVVGFLFFWKWLERTYANKKDRR